LKAMILGVCGGVLGVREGGGWGWMV